MFGLPTFTSIVVFGFPLFWIAYTLVFLWRSRDWDNRDWDNGASTSERDSE